MPPRPKSYRVHELPVLCTDLPESMFPDPKMLLKLVKVAHFRCRVALTPNLVPRNLEQLVCWESETAMKDYPP